MLNTTKFKNAFFAFVVFYIILYVKDNLIDSANINLVKDELENFIVRSNISFFGTDLLKVIFLKMEYFLSKSLKIVVKVIIIDFSILKQVLLTM
jgi:hypothetical protein